MINFRHNQSGNKKIRGAATLIITVVLLTLITLIILFAASNIFYQQKISANTNRANQAFEAAEAGLDYAIPYLKANQTAILANNSGGYLLPYTNSNTTNVALGNGSHYSFVYTNPTANDYTVIKITSTGTSDDATSTRVVSQLIKLTSILTNTPTAPLITKGSLSFSGSSDIYNTNNNTTVIAGSTVSINGSAKTHLSSGVSSSSGNIKSDIQQNVTALANLSNSDMTSTYFGVNQDLLKSIATYYYTNSTSTDYSASLNGKSGTFIWIDQTGGAANLSGTTVIGTAANPVLLVVNGNFNLTGNVTIYGFVYVIGGATTDVLGSVSITGGIMATNNLIFSGSTELTYSPSVLNALQNNGSTSYYARIAGSWKDF